MGVVEDIIDSIIRPIIDLVESSIYRASSLFSEVGEAIYWSIGRPIQTTIERLGSLLQSVMTEFSLAVMNSIQAVNAQIRIALESSLSLFTEFQNRVTTAFNVVKDWVFNAVTAVTDHLTIAWERLNAQLSDWVNVVGGFIDWVKKTLTEKIAEFISVVTRLTDLMLEVMLSIKDVLIEKLSELVTSLSTFAEILSQFLTLKPEDIVKGFIEAQKILIGVKP